MRRTFDRLDITLSILVGLVVGVLGGGYLSELKSEPLINYLQSRNTGLEELVLALEELVGECPEGNICYEAYGTGVEPEYVLQGAIVKVDFVTEEEMIVLAGPEMDGYAEYVLPVEGGTISLCKLTVMMPERVLGDPQMDTIGHEFLHCIVGDFHE